MFLYDSDTETMIETEKGVTGIDLVLSLGRRVNLNVDQDPDLARALVQRGYNYETFYLIFLTWYACTWYVTSNDFV